MFIQSTLTMNTVNKFTEKMQRPGRRSLISCSLSMMLLMAVFATFFWLMRPSTFPIRQIYVEGTLKQLEPGHLQELVKGKVKSGFFSVDANVILDTLVNLPWVKQASVARIWPDGLKIIISEQEAVARWSGHGLLNKQGLLFSPSDDFPLGHLPVLEGEQGMRDILLDRFRVLRERHNLDVVRLRVNDRGAWSFELNNGLVVVLGRRNFDDRSQRFVSIVTSNLGAKLSAAEVIDMRYTNGFAVRWRHDAIAGAERR